MTSRSATRSTRRRCRRSPSRRSTPRRASSCSADPASSAATQVILSQPPEPRGGRLGVVCDRAGAARALGARRRRRALADGRGRASGDGRAPLRRGAPARARLAHRLAAARAAAAGRLGRPRARRVAVGLGPRRAAHPREGERARPRGSSAGGRHAVVHDGVRPRLDHHGDPDAAAGAGAGTERPRGARRAPGDRGRPGASTPSRGRSSTRCDAARHRSPGSRATTAPSTRRRSISCCSRRCGGGPTTRGS